ncbi:MAG: alpha/beta family hydrolase [Pseudomonadota bacterium]
MDPSFLTTPARRSGDPLSQATPPPLTRTPHLLLAHGASQPVTSAFFENLTSQITARGITVHRFEFGYMAQRRSGGSKRPPPRIDTLLPELDSAVHAARKLADVDGGLLFVGGKSMGGRASSLVADRLFEAGTISGWVGISYPFHPVGKPDNLRTGHLIGLNCPAVIVQGQRDPFGTPPEVANYGLSTRIALSWIQDGDHDLKPRKRSGATWDGNLEAAGAAVSDFIWSNVRQT